jgi:hypothetical protein
MECQFTFTEHKPRICLVDHHTTASMRIDGQINLLDIPPISSV